MADSFLCPKYLIEILFRLNGCRLHANHISSCSLLDLRLFLQPMEEPLPTLSNKTVAMFG